MCVCVRTRAHALEVRKIEDRSFDLVGLMLNTAGETSLSHYLF